MHSHRSFGFCYIAIDIILAGPSCADYTGVNAYRQGPDGVQGRYMVLLGELICRIRAKMDPKPVYYMVENSVLRNSKKKDLADGDLERIKHAFKTDWEILLDSRDFSPCCRLRTYLSNIPLNIVDADYVDPPATSCLDGDYKLGANIIKPQMISRANCLMASKSRLDDNRMVVFKKGQQKGFLGRTMTIAEREVGLLFKFFSVLRLILPNCETRFQSRCSA